MTAFTGSSFFEFTIIFAPSFFATSNYLSSISIASILAPVIAFASCVAIKPNPLFLQSQHCHLALDWHFFTALYAVSPAHDKGALVTLSISSPIFTRCL
jgi:hypothetical protein